MAENKKPTTVAAVDGLSEGDRANSSINSNVKAGLGRVQGGVAVYSGAHLIGFLISRRHGVDAVTAAGHSLGRFNDQAAGARALLIAGGRHDRSFW